jgi:hypothetical protein
MSKTDPPEDWVDYCFRVVLPIVPPNGDNETIRWYADIAKPDWIKQEKEKLEYKKLLEREAKEHEKTVERPR